MRARTVSLGQARAYLAKAEEYLAAASSELAEARPIAATSLAIHAAINASNAVTGMRIGRRAVGPDHNQVLALLKEAGKDGAEVERNLGRLLPLKTKTEYEPDNIPMRRTPAPSNARVDASPWRTASRSRLQPEPAL
jgi:hypothetical protein